MELAKTKNIKKLFEQNQQLFTVLGDPYRQQLLLILADHPRTSVRELTTFIGLSRPAISHHLRLLKDAGLLSEVRDGTKRYYHPALKHAAASIKQLVLAIE
jgi:ArsR family transcriptional regulator, arsenate/arsenite/antimonite-responsive transcriptional repressor